MDFGIECIYLSLLFVDRSVNLVNQGLDEGDFADNGKLKLLACSRTDNTHDREYNQEDVAEAEENIEYVIDTAVNIEAVVICSGGHIDDEKNDGLNDKISQINSEKCSAFLNVELAVL